MTRGHPRREGRGRGKGHDGVLVIETMTGNLLVEARTHWGAALGLARSLLGDPARAEDVCQEAFLRLAKRAEEIDRGRPLRPLVLTIVRNLALSELRRLRPTSLEGAIEDGATPPIAKGRAPDEAVGRAELVRRMRRALDRLPPAWRAYLYLREGLGLSPAQIAEVMEATPGVIRTTLHRARLRVREFMASDLVEGSL